jgi:hypothetical protein
MMMVSMMMVLMMMVTMPAVRALELEAQLMRW